MDNFTFPAEERLRDKACIKAVFKRGVKVGCEGAGLFFLPNGLNYNRFLCTFRRNYGCAVVRNSSRRISKEVYRQIKHRLQTGYDLVLLVFSQHTDFSCRFDQMISLFKSAKIYNEAV